MKIKDITRALEAWAPLSLAESYDNVGLLVGDPNAEATGVLINLDVTEALLDEAKALGINLIVTHHPIWFTPIKRLNGDTYVTRVIIKAVREGIALYACHTNLDNVHTGVNGMIGKRLGLQNMRILCPKKEQLLYLICILPDDSLEGLVVPITEAGARQVRTTLSLGGSILECIVPSYQKSAVVAAIRNAHPESVPEFHIMPTQDVDVHTGAGMIGELPVPLPKAEFIELVKRTFDCGGIRYADAPIDLIHKVAWCGGAGSFLTSNAISAGADAFVTGDITYHKFFDNEDKLLLMDIGHYESEQFTSNLLQNQLSKTFPTFAVRLSEIKTNPVKYA